jgi:hypothetical protein
VSDDIEVLTFSRTPTGWAVVERDAVMERLGLTTYDVDLEEYEYRQEVEESCCVICRRPGAYPECEDCWYGEERRWTGG